MNQNIPPLRRIHAACRKLRSLPNNTQEYAEEDQATKITPINKTNPIKSSNHLFMILPVGFCLKRLC